MVNTVEKEHIEIILVGRSYSYQVLQALFAAEPEVDILRDVIGHDSRETISMLYGPDASEALDFCECLRETEKHLEENEADYLDSLRSEYTRLFIGPSVLAAPPWESVYITREKTLFQESTLEVRRFYHKRSFLPTGYPHVADDHLAIELDFMYRLASKTLESFNSGDTEEMRALIADQKDFLAAHLLRWSDQYAEALSKAAAAPLYLSAARYADFFLKTDAHILEELAAISV